MAVINSNISALNAQKSLSSTQVQMSRTMERLSTGVRINSAKDDAAGLAISNRMTTDIRGYSVAIRNANDGISLTQTAEGHLAQITDNLQRIRELAVQSSNASNSTADRKVINLESTQIVAEIDRIANNSKFNNISLLDGTFTAKQFQLSSDNTDSARVSVSIGSAKAGALGVGSGSSYATSVTGAAVGSTALASGALSINGYTTGAASADGVSYSGSSASGIAVAAAINAISGDTGVTATVAAGSLAGAAVTAAGYATAVAAGDISINGVSIGAIAAAGSVSARGGQVAAAVNAVTAQTGVTATFSTTTGAVALAAADGRNITVEAKNSAGSAQVTGLGRGAATSVTGAANALTTAAAIAANTIAINGTSIGAVAAGTATQEVQTITITGTASETMTTFMGATLATTGGATLTATATADNIVGTTNLAAIKAANLTIDTITASAGVLTITYKATAGNVAEGTATMAGGTGLTIGASVQTTKGVTAADAQGALVATAINLKTTDSGVTAAYTGEAGSTFTNGTVATLTTTGVMTLTAPDRAIVVTGNVAANDGILTAQTNVVTSGSTAVASTIRSVVSLSSTQSAGVTVGGATAASLTAAGLTGAYSAATATQGAGVSSLDLSTVSGSQAALTTLDAAIATVNSARANLGAYQNRLQFAVSDLQISSDNLSASRSRIMDTDYAAETTNLAKSQIISQAATAMLAQANQQPQTVLALLK